MAIAGFEVPPAASLEGAGLDVGLLLYVALLGSAASYAVFFANASRGNLTALSSLTFLTPMFAAAVSAGQRESAGMVALGCAHRPRPLVPCSSDVLPAFHPVAATEPSLGLGECLPNKCALLIMRRADTLRLGRPSVHSS